MPRLMNPMPAKGKNFIVLIGVAVVLLTALGVGIFFLVKQLNKKSDGGSGGDKKNLSWKRGLNNGGVGCNQFCTNTGGTWGDTYAKAVEAIVVGPGGKSGLTGKTYKIGDEIDVNEVPGAFYPDGDSTKQALFTLDCGCSN